MLANNNNLNQSLVCFLVLQHTQQHTQQHTFNSKTHTASPIPPQRDKKPPLSVRNIRCRRSVDRRDGQRRPLRRVVGVRGALRRARRAVLAANRKAERLRQLGAGEKDARRTALVHAQSAVGCQHPLDEHNHPTTTQQDTKQLHPSHSF